ncbi:MAG: hypothetical protein HY231_12030 [Acidobacteria bacterium]|nr:hypothetical protein [Acidobacteriota bacterium]
MKNKTGCRFLLAVMVALFGFSAQGWAQQPYGVRDGEIQQLFRRLDSHTLTLKQDVSRALANRRYSTSVREEDINRYLSNFDYATTRLKNNYNSRSTTSSDVEEVLNRGWAIDNYLRTNRLDTYVQNDWQSVRSDLRTLASYYNVSWRWDERSYHPYPTSSEPYPNQNYPQNDPRQTATQNRYPGSGYTRLTGTYTLDLSRSESATNAIDRATRNLDSQEADRVRVALERRLQAPEMLALERQGRHITMISTTAPQVEFDADGRQQVEARNNGRTVRTTASLRGDFLTISSQGDRGNDFSVSFEPIDNGRNLRVIRRFYSDRLSQPITVQSIYRKTNEVAQWNVYTGERTNADYRPDYDRPSGSFIIPNNTTLTAVLNDDLSTRQSRDGDRFSMTVQSPGQYNGAIIEGYVSKVERSGRISGRPEMVLNFQTIRLRNGGTYEFAGFIESVQNSNGETVKVDNEGSVKDTTNQTTRTVTRSGIGAAIGAIIGGIAGGGQGAAIGAVIGAGAGAGTVIAQGREDITLTRGAEFTITSTAPRTDR